MEYPPQPAHPQPIQFYQYRPDSESRHSATFTPLPQEQPVYHGQMMAFPPAHYTAPQYWQPSIMPHGHFLPQEVMTPNRSPALTLSMPAPKMTMDHHGHMDHMRYLNSPTPPTPCLSVCPSTASSPPASSVYPTPTQAHGYFTLPARRFKEEVPVQSFDFEHNWEESTELHIIPDVLDAKTLSGCSTPALSPSSPASSSSPSHMVEAFVSLRDLASPSTRTTASATIANTCPPLPTLSTEDEEHKLAFGGVINLSTTASQISFT